ncbi:MAG: hypothetical protein IPN62_01420 [Flavobacteriales bacterium]|jgi:hypothetical protein|nr:hypothetical protein [Flavobacteriales bacterium]HOZ40042.1 hypothetical protein [Flavobacteriales bacterium]
MRYTLRILSLSLSFAIVGGSFAQSEVISYQWLNQWCGSLLDCEEGCMACNLPASSSAQFFGTNVAWIGVDVCPHPVAAGDNAIGTFGWTVDQTSDKYIMLSGVSTNAVQIDSIIFRHARSAQGPSRVRVDYTRSAMEPLSELADITVQHDFHTEVITDLGCLTTTAQDPFGTFQLQFSPYGSNEGSWYLDEVRIVATPCQISTAVEDVAPVQQVYNGPWYDVLGRPVKGEVPAGVYIGKQRQVKVF